MTSIAYSIQPICAAHRVRHCRPSISLYQATEPFLLPAQPAVRRRESHGFKADALARAQLAGAPQVGGDDVGDFGVAAGGLVLDKNDDWLSCRRHLDCTQSDSLG